MAGQKSSRVGRVTQTAAQILYAPVLAGVLLAFCVTIVVFLLTSVVFTLTPFSDAMLPYLTYITTIISILIGGLYGASKIGHKGWLYGGACGVLYFVGLFLVSLVTGVQIVYGFQLISRLLLSFFIGAVGGILGVNL